MRPNSPPPHHERVVEHHALGEILDERRRGLVGLLRLAGAQVGKQVGNIDVAELPDEFIVDYVRVYDLVDRPPAEP